MDRQSIHQEMERSRATVYQLVSQASPADLRRRSGPEHRSDPMPTDNHPTPITLAARRSQAAAIVAAASGLGYLTAALLVDVVDIVTASALGSVGLPRGDPPGRRRAVGRPMTLSGADD